VRREAIADMVVRLTAVMKPEHIATWLRSPIPALDDRSPLDVIGDGDLRRVLRVISGLEHPGAT
jgi:uncharacterized protein (DUF2384 family)